MSRMGPKGFHLVSCAECKKEFVTRWKRKVYCDACGIARREPDRIPGVRRKLSLAEGRPEVSETIEARSVANSTRSVIDAFWRDRPNYIWAVYLSTDYSLNSSKNRRWSNTGTGSVFLSRGVRDYQNELIGRVRNAVKAETVKHTKLWVSIYVQKPNHRSDAINVIDTICDAIKKAIDLDDRWFCIDRLDWEITKKDPKIFIKIGQEDHLDRIACSHCGRILGLEFFNKGGSKFGVNRSCRDCSKEIDASRRAAKKAKKAAAV